MEILKLTEKDFSRAAELLDVEVAAIKAVQSVETAGRGGFVAPSRPTILFEGHIFWNQLIKNGLEPKNLVNGNEDILYQKWTKQYYKSGIAEYDRLARAIKIHENAANSSASWGMFQIMGFNFAACGCKTLNEFLASITHSEGKQLELFVVFLQKNGWVKYLRTQNWAEFARHYNGPSYALNDYDKKLARAYAKYHTA